MKQTSTALLIFVILVIGTLPQISTDLYTPSLPAIAHGLNAHVSLVQMSISLFILSQAVMQLFYGPLSEGIGRRLSVLLGISIAAVGGVLCLLAKNIDMLLLGRLIQGAGAGACSALFRSIARDVFSGEALSKAVAICSNFVIFSVVAAPFIGGVIQQYFNWRVVFLMLVVYTIFSWLVVKFLFKETSQHHNKDRLKLGFVFKTYVGLFANRHFMSYSLCVFLAMGGLMSWIVSGPVILIKLLGISPAEFGTLTVFAGMMMFFANMTNIRLVKKIGMEKTIRAGLSIMLFAGVLMLALKFLLPMGVLVVLIPAMIFIFGATLIWPNTFALAFGPLAHIAGYAGSVYGFIQVFGGAVFGLIISHIAEQSQLPLACMLIVSAVGAIVVLKILGKPAQSS
jgi:Bcr/CflA subfamily drug resistance transporter